jgi:hypothetical protein
LHAFGLPVQVLPAVQFPQKPLVSHTCELPQAVPAPFGAPSTHWLAPLAQEVVPWRQAEGLPLQALPAVQAAQPPAPLQTWLVPQATPGALFDRSRQFGVPVLQSVVPVLQGAPGLLEQLCPATQVTQLPAPEQT